jgi:Uma2 family endonuclease
MATISAPQEPPRKLWTVADLYRRFGPIPFERIRHDPPPGSGTVDDVVRLNDHEDRLYELVDGILVEKTVGYEESYIGGTILKLLRIFVEPRELGLVAGEAGMLKLDIGLVRIPDVSFVSWARVPGDEFPGEPVPPLIPDLAVEVISANNTPKEMDEKLREYFAKGVRLVWYVRPRSRVVDVYTAPDRFTRLTASMRLDGGDVLPGFSVQVGELFQLPKRPDSKGEGKKNGPQPGKKNGRRRGR